MFFPEVFGEAVAASAAAAREAKAQRKPSDWQCTRCNRWNADDLVSCCDTSRGTAQRLLPEFDP